MTRLKTITLLICLLFCFSCANQEVERAQGAKRVEGKFEGIDLSHHNRITDFNALKRWDFIYHKSTEGNSFIDPAFANRRKKCEELCIPFGAYHFFTTTSSAKSQFENFKKSGGLDCQLAPMIDFEINKGKWSKAKIQRELSTFISLCRKECKVDPIIYSNKGFIFRYNLRKFGCPIWYGGIDDKGKIECDIYQSRYVHAKGFAGKVDYNESNVLFYNNKQR